MHCTGRPRVLYATSTSMQSHCRHERLTAAQLSKTPSQDAIFLASLDARRILRHGPLPKDRSHASRPSPRAPAGDAQANVGRRSRLRAAAGGADERRIPRRPLAPEDLRTFRYEDVAAGSRTTGETAFYFFSWGGRLRRHQPTGRFEYPPSLAFTEFYEMPRSAAYRGAKLAVRPWRGAERLSISRGASPDMEASLADDPWSVGDCEMFAP